jgi:hypothetical protein
MGIYYYRARWYDPAIGRFMQADTIVPEAGNPLALDRYAYSYNNPLKYTDPSGNWPEWLVQIVGGVAQYFNDVTFGGWSAVTGDLDLVNNQAFQDGRKVGRRVSTAQAVAETVGGTAMILAGTSSMGPTAGAGAACSALTGGLCSIPSGMALAGEVALIGAGSIGVAHGSGMIAFMSNSSIADSDSAGHRRQFRSQDRLESHFENHGEEFGYDDAEEYLAGANGLFDATEGVETFQRANGDILFYRRSSNEFGVVTQDNIIRTYFRPKEGYKYWLMQIGEW